jgi:hypothetical protein
MPIAWAAGYRTWRYHSRGSGNWAGWSARRAGTRLGAQGAWAARRPWSVAKPERWGLVTVRG